MVDGRGRLCVVTLRCRVEDGTDTRCQHVTLHRMLHTVHCTTAATVGCAGAAERVGSVVARLLLFCVVAVVAGVEHAQRRCAIERRIVTTATATTDPTTHPAYRTRRTQPTPHTRRSRPAATAAAAESYQRRGSARSAVVGLGGDGGYEHASFLLAQLLLSDFFHLGAAHGRCELLAFGVVGGEVEGLRGGEGVVDGLGGGG